MNIVLAEVQSIGIDLPESVVKQDIEIGEFSDLMKNSIENIPGDSKQVVEIKGLNVEFPNVQATDEATMPRAWVAYLSSAEATVTTDSQPVTFTLAEPTMPILGNQLATNRSDRLIDSDNTLVHLLAGEPLPTDGKVLPPNSEAMGKLPLLASSHLPQHPDTPVILSAEINEEPGAREFQRLNLTRGDSRLSALGVDQNSFVNLDKLSESISVKSLEVGTAPQLTPDAALARQLVITPVGAPTSFQASNPLATLPEALNIVRPDSPAEWSQGLGDRVSWMIDQKLNAASIRLDPPSLGKLEIYIRVTDDATYITINTQSAQTRDLIDNASIRLRDVLEAAGYQNVNVDVGHDRNQPRSEAQQIASAIGESDDNAESQRDLGEGAGSVKRGFFRPDALVDYFA